MKRLLFFLVLLLCLLTGCSGNQQTAQTSASSAIPTTVSYSEEPDYDGYIREEDAFDYVKENYADEMQEWVLDDMIGNHFTGLLDEIMSDKNWPDVEDYLYTFRYDELVALVSDNSPLDDDPPPPDDPQLTYVANKSSMKFHRPDCASVNDIAPSNILDWSGTKEELINKGYEPCKRCNP